MTPPTLCFPDQSPSFAHGFACGRVWERLLVPGARTVSAVMPAETRDTIEAMAMALGWIETVDTVDAEWIEVTLTGPGGAG